MEAEINVDHHLHGYRMTLVHCGAKPILLHRFNGPFIETHAQMTNHPDVLGIALRIDDELKRHNALIICLARFRGELRVNGINDAGRANAAANVHQAATKTAIAAGSYAGAMALSNASAHSETESRVASAAL